MRTRYAKLFMGLCMSMSISVSIRVVWMGVAGVLVADLLGI
jgi:hypothetical protein